jgi:hypothetical protein
MTGFSHLILHSGFQVRCQYLPRLTKGTSYAKTFLQTFFVQNILCSSKIQVFITFLEFYNTNQVIQSLLLPNHTSQNVCQLITKQQVT